jgi:hypothetical protein
MLRNISRFLTPTDTAQSLRGPEPAASDLHAQRAAALSDRAEADARARQIEAELCGLRPPHPDLAGGEVWAQRPAAWSRPARTRRLASTRPGTEVAPGVKLFHDCPLAEIAFHQPLCGPDAPAPFALSLDVLRFEGSFLSLCLHLNEADAAALTADVVFRVDLEMTIESPVQVYARLNMMHGPNQRQILAGLPFEGRLSGRADAGFDLAYAQIDRDQVSAAWIDVILENPAMNAFLLHDMRLSRNRRAGL